MQLMTEQMKVVRKDGREFLIEARVTRFKDGHEGYSSRVFEDGVMINTDDIYHDDDVDRVMQFGFDFVKGVKS
jgi:hypothetical protein